MSRYDADYVMMMVNQRRKELIHEAEQTRLLKATRLEQPCHPSAYRTVANWLGTQMVEWGSRLQCTARASVARITNG